jgi:hypothetical protein
MRQDPSSDFTKERENKDHSLERQSSMELAEYVFMPDREMWHGYLKGCPNFEAYGESFEELQLMLNRLHPDPTGSFSSSACSDTACFAAIGNDEFLEFCDEG